MKTDMVLSLWNGGFAPLGWLFDEQTQWQPACDVEENEDHYLLTLDMPGIPKDQIKVEVLENRVTISGERKLERKRNGEAGWYSERRHGKFERSFTLPSGVAAEKVEAHYENGTLEIYIPKAETAKPKQIPIAS